MGSNSRVLGAIYVKGGGVIVSPLPIENPTTMATNTFGVILLVLAQYVVCSSLAIILCWPYVGALIIHFASVYMWEVKIQETVQAKHVGETFWKNGQ